MCSIVIGWLETCRQLGTKTLAQRRRRAFLIKIGIVPLSLLRRHTTIQRQISISLSYSSVLSPQPSLNPLYHLSTPENLNHSLWCDPLYHHLWKISPSPRVPTSIIRLLSTTTKLKCFPQCSPTLAGDFEVQLIIINIKKMIFFKRYLIALKLLLTVYA